jgi:P27 family predicted phage terminase small subunit
VKKLDVSTSDPAALLTLAPVPPVSLQSDIARRKWTEAAAALIDAAVLKAADLDALESYCLAYQMMCQASDCLAQDGLILVGGMGGPVKHPACGILKDAQAELRQLSNLLGMNPSARARVATGNGKGPKPTGGGLGELMKPRRQ